MTKKGFSVRKIRLTRQIEFLWGVNIKFKIRRGSRWARRGRFGSRMHSAAWSLLKSSVWLEQKIKEAEFCVVCSYACWQLLRLAFAVALLAAFRGLQSKQEVPCLWAVKLVRQLTPSHAALCFSKWHEMFTFAFETDTKCSSDSKLWWYVWGKQQRCIGGHL